MFAIPPGAVAPTVVVYPIPSLPFPPLFAVFVWVLVGGCLREGQGVDAVGGAEAIISHVMSQVCFACVEHLYLLLYGTGGGRGGGLW